MDYANYNTGLIEFLKNSPTPFHATAELKQRLLRAGYVELKEGDRWQLQPGGRYLVVRNDSSLIAFALGSAAPEETGFRMVGAHTDSPCLRVKPEPQSVNKGY